MISDEYCAGFLDGEGCIRVSTIRPKGRTQTYYALQVTIVNCNKEVLDLIQERFGGSLRSRASGMKYSKIGPWRECWTLTMQGSCAAWFLQVVDPYVIVKRKEVKVARDFFARFPPAERKGSRGFTKIDFEIMQEFKERLELLKRGGDALCQE